MKTRTVTFKIDVPDGVNWPELYDFIRFELCITSELSLNNSLTGSGLDHLKPRNLNIL